MTAREKAEKFFAANLAGKNEASLATSRFLIEQAIEFSASWGDPLGNNPFRRELIACIDNAKN